MRVEGRGLRVEGRGSRVEGRGVSGEISRGVRMESAIEVRRRVAARRRRASAARCHVSAVSLREAARGVPPPPLRPPPTPSSPPARSPPAAPSVSSASSSMPASALRYSSAVCWLHCSARARASPSRSRFCWPLATFRGGVAAAFAPLGGFIGGGATGWLVGWWSLHAKGATCTIMGR